VPPEAIFAGIGVIVTGAAGIYLAVREARRRERKASQKEIADLVHHVDNLSNLLVEQSAEVDALTKLLLEQRRYIYKVVSKLIDAGIDVPPPPAPSFDPGEYDKEDVDASRPVHEGGEHA